jgi:2-keto-3-deoxy-L-fuconate dehydrogenase
MSGRLAGKRAVITAAGQGIGRAAAEAFVREGAAVIAADINERALHSLSDCETRALDVTDAAAIEVFCTEVGPIDTLFNCAGNVHAGTIQECAESNWDFAFEINCRAMFRLMKAFLPGMLEKGAGSIINMSSIASSAKAVPNRFVYSASKAAVIGMTKSVAVDFVGRGIRCNAICAGTVQTPSLAQRIAAQAEAQGSDVEQVRASFVARQPMGRLGRPEEIAALVGHLSKLLPLSRRRLTAVA